MPIGQAAMKGQMMMFNKPIIWHYSLTAIYTECPYCHSHNTEDARTGECRCCHNIIDLSNEVVKKSRDVIECEKLGLKGAVYKDEKGKWCERNV